MPEIVQWQVLGPEGQVQSGWAFTLRCTVNNRSLRYREREYGINLDWDKSEDLANVAFRSVDGAPIRYGDRVSLLVADGGDLRYGVRDYGINLEWSNEPVHEWVVGGGEIGQPVLHRDRVSLLDTTLGDHLVYGARDYGINLRWWSDVAGAGAAYPPLPMPSAYHSPSGEAGQAELSGVLDHVTVFHGGTADELDWNLYVTLDDVDRTALRDHFAAHATVKVSDVDVPVRLPDDQPAEIGCELMVIDCYDNQLFDELFFSADVTQAFQLEGTAWQHSVDAGEAQNVSGSSKAASSALAGHRVWVQGPLVNDREHGVRVELHSLDSIAYPMTADGQAIDAAPGTEGWPTDSVVWRVAVFSTSTQHRIAAADYLKRDRRTRWYLPGPTVRPGHRFTISAQPVGFSNEAVRHDREGRRRPTPLTYESYGVRGHAARIARDPRDGIAKLRVDVTMADPRDDWWGGMFLTDYTVGSRSSLADPGEVVIDITSDLTPLT